MTTENTVQWSGNHVHSFELTAEDASSMAHQGKCDDDVFAGVRIPYIAAQFDTIAADAIRSELADYGAWDEVELADDDANRNRFLWCVANDIRERPEDYDPKPKITTSGYTNCEACDEPAMGDLCEWCRLGALANNHDPESIASANFDTQLLAVWRASGEAIADREQDEADVTMRTAFDAAVGAARGIRAAALAAAEDVYAAALATAWSHLREPDTRDQDKN